MATCGRQVARGGRSNGSTEHSAERQAESGARLATKVSVCREDRFAGPAEWQARMLPQETQRHGAGVRAPDLPAAGRLLAPCSLCSRLFAAHTGCSGGCDQQDAEGGEEDGERELEGCQAAA